MHLELKLCSKCGAEKPRTEFYGRAASSDCLQPYCKLCDRASRRERYLLHHASETAYRRAYQKTPHGAKAHYRANKGWRERSPIVQAAYSAVNNAVRRGSLIKQLCLMCGEKAEAHHPDYSCPLDVVWLCPKHHKETHSLVKSEAA